MGLKSFFKKIFGHGGKKGGSKKGRIITPPPGGYTPRRTDYDHLYGGNLDKNPDGYTGGGNLEYYDLARKKIENGEPLGWRMLAVCYENGWVLKRNPTEAERCREIARHLDNSIIVQTPNPKPEPASNPESEVLELEHSPFNISMVAPSGFGKTTLLVTIMNSAENKMNNPKKGLSIACKDEDDQRRLKEAHNKLNNDIMACVDNFTAKVEPTLPGTGEPKKFNFYFQQSEEEASFRQPFSIMDIPGGWINPNNLITDEMNIKWEDFKEHLHVSRLLFVPIDATLIMECSTEKEKCAAVKILDNSSTSELIKEWARYRKGEFDETGKTSALFFVPVKCEKYRNKAQDLEEKVKQYFANTASQVHSICPDIQQYYIPLETLGCVELSRAKWETEEGKEAFYPSFRKMKESDFLQPKNVEVLFSMMYHMAAQEMETTINKFDPADKKEFQEIIEPFMKELKSNGDISEIEKHRINWW